jgi:plastocyanin
MKRTLIVLSLAAIVGSAAACGSSSTPASPTTPSAPTASADVTVSIQGEQGNQSYSPNPTTMHVGQTVAWHNVDSITHTATGDTSNFNTGTVAGGAASTPVMMSTAGTFTYHCSIHPGMVGTITVQ